MITGTARTQSTPLTPDSAEGDVIGLHQAATAGLHRAVAALREQQRPEGYWCGELEGDSILQSEYILLKWIVEQEDDERLGKIANYLRKQQRDEDGAWVQYPGAEPDLSATVKGYFALKLTGDDINAAHMAKARDLILRMGGAERCNTYTRFYLAPLRQGGDRLAWSNLQALCKRCHSRKTATEDGGFGNG